MDNNRSAGYDIRKAESAHLLFCLKTGQLVPLSGNPDSGCCLIAWSRVLSLFFFIFHFSSHVLSLSKTVSCSSLFSFSFSSFLTHFYAKINHSNQYPCISLSLNTSQSSFLHLFFIILSSSLTSEQYLTISLSKFFIFHSFSC